MDDYRTFAMTIAKEAGGLLKKKINDIHMIFFKGEINIVTEADRMSEDMILSAIRDRFPHHDILSEESSATETGAAFRWIVDPWMERQIMPMGILFSVYPSPWKGKVTFCWVWFIIPCSMKCL